MSSSDNSLIMALDQPNIWVKGCAVRYINFINVGAFINLNSDCTMLLENTLMHDLSATFGGVIQMTLSQISIKNCTFRNNFAFYASAILAQSISAVIIEDSLFIGNHAESYGAIRVSTNTVIQIFNS